MELKYNEICNHFEKLNHDSSHFVNSNDICTPIGCVKEMVDTIPNEFWNRKNIKILDSCCGNGNFPAYLVTKTNLSNIYFNDININEIVQVYGFFPDQPEYILFGKKYKDSWPTSKRAENIIVSNFMKEHDKKPIGCTQK